MKRNSIMVIGSILTALLWSSASGFSTHSFRRNDPSDTMVASLTEKQREDLIKSVHSKVKRLEEYITLIASKKLSGSALDEKIKQCVELFLDEKRLVQSVSKDKDGIEKHRKSKVREYFVRLATIPAIKVDITFYEVSKLTNLRPGPQPDTWYATAYIYQDTKIYYGNEVKLDYYDRTVKQIDIITQINTQQIGDEVREEYVTRLGNIQVKEVK
jgi:hypothetical protein